MPEHQSQTDQIKKVQLPSALQQVLWTKPMASPGERIRLEIYTHFVGNGSELKIELSDNSGKNHGNFSDKIHGNRFSAEIKVPANAKDELYATVKLPKHGLSMKSAPLILLPPVQITNTKWDKQEARRGDILKLTADVKGVPDSTEALIEILEHDADDAHDFVTKFPVLVKNKKVEAEWEFEYHEDTDDIPTAKESEKGYQAPEYFFQVKVGEVMEKSGLLKFQDWIEFELVDGSGAVIANEDYILHFADGQQRKGKLDDKGYAKEQDIPPGKVTVEFSNLDGITLKAL